MEALDQHAEETSTMAKYAIAFVTPEVKKPLRHRIVESTDQEAALKKFFDEETARFYSTDEQGYYYFKEDFFDELAGGGSILVCE